MSQKDEILTTRIGGFGSSDAKMIHAIGKNGFINEAQRQRIAIMLGLEKHIEFIVKATAHGNKIESELYDYLKDISPNTSSNPYYEATELTNKYGFSVFNHIDYEIISEDSVTWFELKSVNDGAEDILDEYKCQTEWHKIIMDAVYPTKNKVLYLLHYHTTNKDDSFDAENLTKHNVNSNQEIQHFIFQGLQIISDCIKAGFTYTPNAEQDKTSLSDKIQNGDIVPDKLFVRTINPSEFGLDINPEVEKIETAFIPKVFEREILATQYNALIVKEITPQLCKEANELRKKLVKVRTGIAEVHKLHKAFFLSAGKFVDAWKNKETLPVEQMEEKLSEIETHYAKIEQQRLEKLKSDRTAILIAYSSTPELYNAELLTEEAFIDLVTGLRLMKEQKDLLAKQAEDLRLETERKEQLFNSRREQVIPYFNFIAPNQRTDYGNMINEEFDVLLNDLKAKKAENDKILEEQRIENERLKAEAEAREKQLFKERQESEMKLNAEREASRIALEKQQAEIKLKNDQIEKARKEAEQKQIEEQKAKELLLKAPLKEKLTNWVDAFEIGLPAGLDTDNATVADITNKFNAFKNWAIKQIEII